MEQPTVALDLLIQGNAVVDHEVGRHLEFIGFHEGDGIVQVHVLLSRAKPVGLRDLSDIWFYLNKEVE